MRLDKCDVHIKVILGSRGGNSYISAARGGSKEKGTKEEITKVPQGEDMNPGKNWTDKWRRGLEHPETRNRRGNSERESRQGSNQEVESTRRECYQTESFGEKET